MTWWHYLLLVNLYLLVFYGFYALLLRNETFFQLNRVYLVAGAALSFSIPLIQAGWIKNLFITQRVQQTIYATINPEFIYHAKPIQNDPVTIGQMFAVVYIGGTVFLLCRFVLQLFTIKQLINRIGYSTAFSFFNKVIIDGRLPGQQTIIAHEDVHVRQWHSADVLFIEAVMICNWFNPIVYFYRKAIKHVHEFIADKKAIEKGTSKTEYALLLLSQTFGTSPHQLTNNFFSKSLLKRRIIMLNRDKSKRRRLLKYGLSAPLFACMLILSAATVKNSEVITIINKKTDQIFRMAPLPPTKPVSQLLSAITISTAKKEEVNFPPPVIRPQPLTTQEAVDMPQATAAPAVKANTVANQVVFTAVELSPTFPGGEAAFSRFLQEHLRYPTSAKDQNVQGRVYAQFVVEKDGNLSNIKIVRDPGAGLGDEAVRVLAESPRWSPGVQNGHTVRVQYTVPVNFSLDLEPSQPERHDTLKKIINVISHARLNGLAHKPDSAINVAGRATGTNYLRLSSATRNTLNPDSVKTVYLIDGKEITADQAEKLKGIPVNKIMNIRIIDSNKALSGDIKDKVNKDTKATNQ